MLTPIRQTHGSLSFCNGISVILKWWILVRWSSGISLHSQHEAGWFRFKCDIFKIVKYVHSTNIIPEHLCTCLFMYRWSYDHVVAVQCTKSCRYRSGASGNVRIKDQNGNKCDLSDFDHWLCRQAGVGQRWVEAGFDILQNQPHFMISKHGGCWCLFQQREDCGRLQARKNVGRGKGQVEDFCEDLGQLVFAFLQDPFCHTLSGLAFFLGFTGLSTDLTSNSCTERVVLLLEAGETFEFLCQQGITVSSHAGTSLAVVDLLDALSH